MSGSFAFGAEANDKLANGENSFSFGLFSSLYDSDHFDFDIFGSVSDSLELTPGVELNFDIRPDLIFAGFYLRTEHAMTGVEDKSAEVTTDGVGTESATYKIDHSTQFTFGGYYTINEKVQLLTEFDLALNYDAPDEKEKTELGSLAFGLNYAILDSIELISQINYDIPQNEEDGSFAVNIGFVATMPSIK